MSEADDPLALPEPVFDEAWQAQALALADAMMRAGHFTATDWAETLGAELAAAEAAGRPDTLETYYLAALGALERLAADRAGITATDQAMRKADWHAAYLGTPHGAPVELSAADNRH